MKKGALHDGEKIKKIRSWKGLTQNDLADKIHLTRSMISNIEVTGKVNHHTFQNILKIFGMTQAEFENFDGKTIGLNEPNVNYGSKSEQESLKQKFEAAQREIQTLKDLIKSQKKLIEMLEKRKLK